MAARAAKLQQAWPPVLLAVLAIRLGLAGVGVHAVFGQDFQQRYAERLQATAADDLAARYALARWLFDQGAFSLALQHVQLLEARMAQEDKLDPSLSQQVRFLRLQVQQRLKSPGDSQPAASPLPPHPLLTPQQINVIRVWESDPTQQPRVRIPRAILDQVLVQYGDSPLVPKGRAQREVQSWPGWRKLELLFALRAREFYGSVQVLDEPRSLAAFRQSIHPGYVLSTCASVNCHASADRGLTLYRTAPASDATLYTNFYILSQAATPSGRLIDRAEPEKSLLVQYGLPREQAQTPHPSVPGWRAALRGRQDPLYARLVQWIGRQLYQPEPDYGIDPAPPTPALSPLPATTTPLQEP